jgi:hypothetical protein
MSEYKAPAVESDLVLGAAAIGRELGLSADQIYYHYERGRLDAVISKMGPRLLVASRARLREWPARLASENR